MKILVGITTSLHPCRDIVGWLVVGHWSLVTFVSCD